MTPRKTTSARKTPTAKGSKSASSARNTGAPRAKAPPSATKPAKKRPRKPAAKRPKRVHVAPGLSADEFKGEIARRGWTMQQVANRWEMGRNWLYKLAANPFRGPRWDDAVRGLPQVLSPE